MNEMQIADLYRRVAALEKGLFDMRQALTAISPTAPVESQPQEVFCPHCQGGNPPDGIHCIWCGLMLAAPEPLSAPIPPPPAPPRPSEQRREHVSVPLPLPSEELFPTPSASAAPPTISQPPPVEGTAAPAHERMEASPSGVYKVPLPLAAQTTQPAPMPPPPPARVEQPRRSPVDVVRRTEFWLNKVGIILFLFGVAFLFKYAVDNQWLSEPVRVAIGLLLGSALMLTGLRLRRARRHFSQVLMGGGIATYYITGYASVHLFPTLNVPYALILGFMSLVTVLAFVLSLRQGDVSLSLIGLTGGLLTPYVLDTFQVELVWFGAYTCLILTGTAAIYLFKGWRSLLWASAMGAWLTLAAGYGKVFSRSADEITLDDRWALQAAALFVLLALWAVPVLREVLWTRNPARWPRPSLASLDPPTIQLVNAHVGVLTVMATLVTLAISPLIWLGLATAQMWGWVALGGAVVFATVFLALRPLIRPLAYTHAFVAFGLLNIGLLLLLRGDALLVAFAVEASLLHLLAWRFSDRAATVGAHSLFGVVGLWLAYRLLSGILERGVFGTEVASPIFNLPALTDLAVIGMALAVSFIVRPKQAGFVMLACVHVAFMAWIWREVVTLPNGTGYLGLAWAAYGLLLHLLSRRVSDPLYSNGASIAAHSAFVALLPIFALRLGTGFVGDTPILNWNALLDIAVVGMALAASFVARPAPGLRPLSVGTLYRLFVHSAVLGWLVRETVPLEQRAGYVMLSWAAYLTAIAFISRRAGDRITLALTGIPYIGVAVLFALRIFIPQEGVSIFNINTLIDASVLALALATSFVIQPRETATAFHLCVHAGVLGLLWRELHVLPQGYQYVALAWAAYALLLHLAAWRFREHWTSLAAHANFAACGLWLVARMAYGLYFSNEGQTAVFNVRGLTDLGIMALAAIAFFLVRPHKLSLAYGLSLHIVFLGWLWQELGLIPNGGNGFVTIAWGAYAIILLAASMRLDWNRILLYCGVSTLFAVAAKLFLIDLQYLEAIWRILLFLGFGALFLVISYFFQNVVKRDNESPEPLSANAKSE